MVNMNHEAVEFEIKRLRDCCTAYRDEIGRWKSEQRRAFAAGFKARNETPDIDKAWQQYRCQDDTDWQSVPELTKDNADSGANS